MHKSFPLKNHKGLRPSKHSVCPSMAPKIFTALPMRDLTDCSVVHSNGDNFLQTLPEEPPLTGHNRVYGTLQGSLKLGARPNGTQDKGFLEWQQRWTTTTAVRNTHQISPKNYLRIVSMIPTWFSFPPPSYTPCSCNQKSCLRPLHWIYMHWS